MSDGIVRIYGGEVSFTCWRIDQAGQIYWIHAGPCVIGGRTVCGNPITEDVPQEILDEVKRVERAAK